MSLLSVENLNAHYGTSHILHDVSLTVDKGELNVLIGRNGAGKTTTIKSIMGLLEPTSGTVTFADEDITTLPPHKTAQRGIALIPETRDLFPQLTVLENLRLGHLGYNVDDEAELERIYDYFPRLQERHDQNAGSLSGGEQQMLAIGRALISKPDFLLIDEPTEGLMPTLVEKLQDILVRINEEGISMLLVEQNVNLALEIGDRGYIIDEGIIEMTADCDELVEKEEIIDRYLAV